MKLQKIPIDGGFSCPNRDGTCGHGGCSFCRNEAFAPSYCREAGSIAAQLEVGKRFFGRKHRGEVGYVAYFQSYTGTHASIGQLRSRYDEALSVEGIVGLAIGTRPDCLSDEVLDLLSDLQKRTDIQLEVGVESCYDATLLRVGRGHDFACTVDALRRASARGFRVGIHLIIGLPGESSQMILREADILSELPIASLKLHQLQIVEGTRMAEEWRQRPEAFMALTLDEYVALVADFVARLRKDITVERFAAQGPRDMVLWPKWGVKPALVEERIQEELRKRDVSGHEMLNIK